MHGGAYDELTLWEQIDEGAQYTPAKKWLFSVPVVLYVTTSLPIVIDPQRCLLQILGIDALYALQPLALCH
jgi:hypothetical protein